MPKPPEDDWTRSLYGCADQRFAVRKFAQAQDLYDQVIDETPGHYLVSSARRKSIAAEVAAIRGKGTGTLPDPIISGRSGSSAAKLTIRNSSPYPLEVLLSGPDARSVWIPACTGCKKYSQGSEPAGCPRGLEKTVRIRAGTYTMVAQSLSLHDVDAWSGDRTLTTGYAYSDCFFIVTSRY